MSITHHPGEATLLRHAAGGGDPATRAVVAAHIEACPRCRADLRLGEAVGGQLLEALPPAELASDALARALAMLDAPASPPVSAPPRPTVVAGPGGMALPTALAPYACKPGGIGRWRRVAPGIRYLPILPRRADSAALFLLRIAPGTAMPEHGHNGAERVCVLSGSFSDSLGRFGPGDLAETDEEIEHQPRADTGADCVCLIASAAPLRFRSLAARMLQPVLGI